MTQPVAIEDNTPPPSGEGGSTPDDYFDGANNITPSAGDLDANGRPKMGTQPGSNYQWDPATGTWHRSS